MYVKIVVIGGGDTGVELAKALIQDKHEVLLVESRRERAEELAEKLDCEVIHGDASDPAVLSATGIEEADLVIVLTGSDKDNILIALLAKNMGAKEVIVRLENPGYNEVLVNAGIAGIINPSRLVVEEILSLIKGVKVSTVSAASRGNVIVAFYKLPRRLSGKKLSDLKLGGKARVLLVYRGDEALFPEDKLVLQEGDELLIACHTSYLSELDKAMRE
ncbi:MAG: potassium transporter TrkA [Thermoprotei archaeon]|nr:MAG: potassium transporter TrkA [Thermoprotei archaeon]